MFRIVLPVEDHFDFVYPAQCERWHMVIEPILGRPCHPVYAVWQGMGAIGLDGHIEACTMQLFHKRIIHLQRRLTARQHHKTTFAPGTYGIHDVGYSHWLIGGEVSITERASQVAAAEAHEDCGAACVAAFAL